MSTMQIRNVSKELRAIYKARAAMAGMSLSEYLLNELKRLAQQPTMEEMLERLARRPPLRARLSTAQIIREERRRR